MPIHKRGDKSECDNYRPISLISNISKLIENEQLLFEGQFEFRNNWSTTDALIDITERIRDACDNHNHNCNSHLYFISHVVPQGLVLGPLLFIIFINEM